MERKIPRSFGLCQLGRAALPLVAAAAAVVVLAACSSQASAGNGTVQLSATSGPTSGKPTWSTNTACPAGFRGSAIFREVHADGTTTNSISKVVNGTAAPFSGTLQATMAQIQTAGGIATGGTQELVVICFSGPSLTGTSDNEMDTFVTYNADGTYSSSGTQPVPVGEIGGIALAGLAAIGLGFLQFRRIRSRRKQPVASA